MTTEIRPNYYKNNGMEVFDVIKAFSGDMTGIEAFAFGNVMKYICRYKHKNGLEDLRKAQTYLNLLMDVQKGIEQDDLPSIKETVQESITENAERYGM